MTIDLHKLKRVEELYDKYLQYRSETIDKIIEELIAINGEEEKYIFSDGNEVILSSILEIEHRNPESTIKQVMADMRYNSTIDSFERKQDCIRKSQISLNEYGPDNPYNES